MQKLLEELRTIEDDKCFLKVQKLEQIFQHQEFMVQSSEFMEGIYYQHAFFSYAVAERVDKNNYQQSVESYRKANASYNEAWKYLKKDITNISHQVDIVRNAALACLGEAEVNFTKGLMSTAQSKSKEAVDWLKSISPAFYKDKKDLCDAKRRVLEFEVKLHEKWAEFAAQSNKTQEIVNSYIAAIEAQKILITHTKEHYPQESDVICFGKLAGLFVQIGKVYESVPNKDQANKSYSNAKSLYEKIKETNKTSNIDQDITTVAKLLKQLEEKPSLSSQPLKKLKKVHSDSQVEKASSNNANSEKKIEKQIIDVLKTYNRNTAVKLLMVPPFEFDNVSSQDTKARLNSTCETIKKYIKETSEKSTNTYSASILTKVKVMGNNVVVSSDALDCLLERFEKELTESPAHNPMQSSPKSNITKASNELSSGRTSNGRSPTLFKNPTSNGVSKKISETQSTVITTSQSLENMSDEELEKLLSHEEKRRDELKRKIDAANDHALVDTILKKIVALQKLDTKLAQLDSLEKSNSMTP